MSAADPLENTDLREAHKNTVNHENWTAMLVEPK